MFLKLLLHLCFSGTKLFQQSGGFLHILLVELLKGFPCLGLQAFQIVQLGAQPLAS